MGETCSKTRILSVVVAVLVLVLAAVVAAFIYRATRNVNDKIGRIMRSELNENTVKDLYPGYFRSQEEQRLFEKKFLQSFYFNRTVIPPTVKSKETCSFRCFNSSSPFPPRRKRQSNNGVKHGCCTSRAGFYVPTNHTNLIGQVRTFLQYGSKKQYFPVESCTAVFDCTGCECSQQYNLVTAVVVKFGVGEVDDIEDTEIDQFSIAGCCKCVNN